MAKLILQVRTRDNLLELLANGETPPWDIPCDNEQMITNVRIVRWDGDQMLEGVYDPSSSRTDEGMLIVRFFDARIVNCRIDFYGRNAECCLPSLTHLDINPVNPAIRRDEEADEAKGKRKTRVMPVERYLTVAQAAETLRVAPKRIKKWIAEERLQAIDVGMPGRPSYRIAREALPSLIPDKHKVRKCKFV